MKTQFSYDLKLYEKQPGVYFINNVICYGTETALRELHILNGHYVKTPIGYQVKYVAGNK